MATEVEELLDFLSSPSPPIKKAAVNIVRDYTGSEDGLRSLGKYFSVAVPSLSRLLAEKKEVSEPAAEALVNLSQVSDLAGKMVEMGIIKTAMDFLYKQDCCAITRLLVMLHVNLTRSDVGIESLLQIQAECEELQRRVETLNIENGTLRDELRRLSQKCEKITSENNSIKEELTRLCGPDIVSELENSNSATHVQPREDEVNC